MSKEIDLRYASDKIAMIADMVEELSDAIDKFRDLADETICNQFDAVWLGHVSRAEAKALAKLSLKLAPPDEYDPADRNLVA